MEGQNAGTYRHSQPAGPDYMMRPYKCPYGGSHAVTDIPMT